jgi:DNA-directed RNA polymerase specialized sigma24 family protein
VRRRRANYNEEEVRALIEHYEVLREKSDVTPRGLKWLTLRTDLDAVLAQIPEEYWGVVLLHGLIGFTQTETAQLLQTSQRTVSRHYQWGIEETVYLLNHGPYGGA